MPYIPKSIRQQVEERAHHRCEYCLAPEEIGVSLEVEHIIPQSKGGSDHPDNLCFACDDCNGSKAAFLTGIDPETNTEILLFNPRTEQWSNHFRWSEDLTEVVPLSATGRATISRLKINRESRKKMRVLWAIVNLHPPKEES